MRNDFYPEQKERFRFRDVWWKPIMKVSEKNANVRDIYQIKGPFCLDCMGKLVFESDSSTIGICPICSRKHNLSTNYESLRQLAHIRYQAKLDNC